MEIFNKISVFPRASVKLGRVKRLRGLQIDLTVSVPLVIARIEFMKYK
jgi:hypothetical protein